MGKLFISHSSLDNDRAVKVRDWLKSQGWSDVFLDLDPSQGLAPGQRWQEELKRAGENCAAVIVLISPNWITSIWCRAEFLVADQLGKRIFPVFVAPTSFDDVPSDLKAKFQLADISTPEKEAEGFHRLATGLKRAGLDPKSFDWPPANEPNRAIYRGLQALDVQDAAIFFGRDAAITRGLDRLRRLRDGSPERVLAILGASGAGKSSFLRAGLISRLKRDEENFVVFSIVRPENAALTGTNGLSVSASAAAGRSLTLTTGADLVGAFEAARAPIVERLRRTAEAARETYTAKPPTVIIPIDQAEELFGAENAERDKFCEILASAIEQDKNAVVVAAIRSDAYEALQSGFMPDKQEPFTLPPVALGAFQEIIMGPARLARPPLTVEPELTQQLLADLDEDDALPLLAFTLERLQREYGQIGKLTLADYGEKLGGLSGAIQSAVSAALGVRPSQSDLALARQLFIPALVQVDEDGVKRRVATRLPPDTLDLAKRMIDQRLLISDAGKIEVAHEAILRQWPALVGWIAEERGALVTLDGVRAAARDWCAQRVENTKKARGESWLTHRGERLKDAEKIAARADFAAVVNDDMRAYLDACRKEERRAAASRLRIQVLAGVSAAALIGVGFAFATQDKWRPPLDTYLRYARFVHSAAELNAVRPGTEFQDCSQGSKDCPVMVVIPAGRFNMGSTDNDPGAQNYERPLHPVTIARFAVSKFDVTFDDWQTCVNNAGCPGTPDDLGGGRGTHPLINVSWNEAQAYVHWLSQETGTTYRLLSEAQWEYAARGTTSLDAPHRLYPWGDAPPVCDRHAPNGALFNGCPQQKTLPVGSFQPNAFGLYDMAGNVWQWVQDCYANSYAGLPTNGSAYDQPPCTLRVLRGGSLVGNAQDLRSASRDKNYPEVLAPDDGFRVARML